MSMCDSDCTVRRLLYMYVHVCVWSRGVCMVYVYQLLHYTQSLVLGSSISREFTTIDI